jgi:hypothetical protein
MALIFLGRSTCPICSQIINADDSIVSTTAFINDVNHPFWRFNDAAMHQVCFASWKQRNEFISVFNDYFHAHYRGMRFMLEDGAIEERDIQN